jgi:hypothetical protein
MRGPARGIVLLLAGCAAAAPALAGVSASLDSSQIASGDTVQLTLEHDGQTSGQPDLAPLQQDFDVLGTSSSTTFELINGSASEKTEVVLTLAPKVTGHLTIPSLSWDGEQSQPLALNVTGPGGAGQAGAPGAAPAATIFIKTTASPEQPYVEAAVHLTVRVFTSETLYHGDLELPENSNVVVKQIGSDEDSDTMRNGRTYRVVTRQYLLFPLHSGELTVPGPVLDAEVAVNRPRSTGNPFGGFFGGRLFSGMFRTVAPVRVHGKPIVLSVRPRPAGAVGSYWLPARNVTLSAAWDPAQLTARAGDPVTLDLDLQATGLTAAQLPDLSTLLSFPSGLKAYPDQPKLDDSSQNGTLVGTRDQTIALLAGSPGHYAIPALTVTWWDTETNQSRTVTLPARTLTILPAPGSIASPNAAPAATAAGSAASSPASAIPTARPGQSSTVRRQAAPPAPARNRTPAHSSSEWEWISIALAAVWLATLGAWLWSRRSRPNPSRRDGSARASDKPSDHSPPLARSAPRPRAPKPREVSPDAGKEHAAFRTACEANDAHAARAHLLAWTAARWGAAPAGINAVAATIGDANVSALLRDLDRACYAGGTWEGRPLAAALTDLPAPPGKAAPPRGRLAPLYPENPADRTASIRRRT